MEVKVVYHQESDGAWWAESDDAPGFYAAAPSLPVLRDEVRAGLQFHFGADDEIDLRESRPNGDPVAVVHVTATANQWWSPATSATHAPEGSKAPTGASTQAPELVAP